MPDLNWPKALIITILVLGLFFGANYFYQHHFKKAPFLEDICRLEAVDRAEITSEKGSDTLIITPDPAYRGLLQDLYSDVEKKLAAVYRDPPAIRIEDRRSATLDRFAAAASPAIYEAARSGRYRQGASHIDDIAAAYGLTDAILTVDSRYLYLQARDSGYFLYQIVPLPPFQEGEGADA